MCLFNIIYITLFAGDDVQCDDNTTKIIYPIVIAVITVTSILSHCILLSALVHRIKQLQNQVKGLKMRNEDLQNELDQQNEHDRQNGHDQQTDEHDRQNEHNENDRQNEHDCRPRQTTDKHNRQTDEQDRQNEHDRQGEHDLQTQLNLSSDGINDTSL